MDGMTPTQKKNLEKMKLKDLKAKNYLFQSLDKSILKTITQKETSKQLWDSMKMKCQGYGGRGRGKTAFRGGRGQGRGKGRLNWSKDTVECYKCHKLRHFQYECQANYANLDESEKMVLMAYTDTLGVGDVIFEEEEQWNWERSFEDDIRFDLEREDGNGEEVKDSDDGSEEENVASPVRDESSDGNEEDEAAPPMTPRVRKAPTYLNDFVSGDGLSDEGEETKYMMEVLRHFGMEHSNSVENPMVPGFKISKDENGIEMDGSFFKQLIGSMMYLTATRSDIMYAVSLLSRYMSRPTEVHHSAAKRILRYLQGTTTFDILYRRGGSHELIGFNDSDYAGSVEDRRSTSGYVCMLSGAVVT
ncbi:hypothetical protein KIW84_073263 [Lathyrus oleraceus]|uniref:Uncharacterized protein n=1 Tax=Pisum sativum TaxID=3888 RepID=A0A9D4VNN2_PEA|nr:hypothetical protein KIW84_073263 [Pisum sativum]